MSLEVGSRLGHYAVTALIGEGGMGQVYQARDTKLDRPSRFSMEQVPAHALGSLSRPVRVVTLAVCSLTLTWCGPSNAERERARAAEELRLSAAAQEEAFMEYHQDYYLKNPLRYKFYSYQCGHKKRLEQLWGDTN